MRWAVEHGGFFFFGGGGGGGGGVAVFNKSSKNKSIDLNSLYFHIPG
jgi:hypothetical protein